MNVAFTFVSCELTMKQFLAEMLNRPWYLLGSRGSALAFGLIVPAMNYAIVYILRAHLNPAVTLACVTARRMDLVSGEECPFIRAKAPCRDSRDPKRTHVDAVRNVRDLTEARVRDLLREPTFSAL